MILEGAETIVKEEVLKEDYLCTICFRNTKYLISYPSKFCVMVNDAFATNKFGLLCRKILRRFLVVDQAMKAWTGFIPSRKAIDLKKKNL